MCILHITVSLESRLLKFAKIRMLYVVANDKPMMTEVIKDSKVTAALWGPLDEIILTGHENGDLMQWDVKVQSRPSPVST